MVWNSTCHLLRQTLNSLIAQSNGNWIACVAGHECPEFLADTNDGRISFHKVDFDQSLHEKRPVIDKSWKVAYASMCAANLQPKYHMLLDADDLLHRDLVSLVAGLPPSPAVVFEFGWEFDIGFRRALPRNNLASLCGSTTAYSREHFPMPMGRGWDEWNKVPAIKTGHNAVIADLDQRGLVPFLPQQRLVAYVTGHVSSLGRRHLKRPWRRRLAFWLLGKPLSHELKRDFQVL